MYFFFHSTAHWMQHRNGKIYIEHIFLSTLKIESCVVCHTIFLLYLWIFPYIELFNALHMLNFMFMPCMRRWWQIHNRQKHRGVKIYLIFQHDDIHILLLSLLLLILLWWRCTIYVNTNLVDRSTGNHPLDQHKYHEYMAMIRIHLDCVDIKDQQILLDTHI